MVKKQLLASVRRLRTKNNQTYWAGESDLGRVLVFSHRNHDSDADPEYDIFIVPNEGNAQISRNGSPDEIEKLFM